MIKTSPLAEAAQAGPTFATIDWLMLSQGQASRSFRFEAIRTTTYLVCVVVGLPWGATGVAIGLAVANLLLFAPGFAYAARGTSIRFVDVLKALLPCFALMVVTVSAVFALRVFVAQDWNSIVRLLVTGALIAGIMICGSALVYGRSVLNPHFLISSLTRTLFAERR